MQPVLNVVKFNRPLNANTFFKLAVTLSIRTVAVFIAIASYSMIIFHKSIKVQSISNIGY